MSNNNNNDDRFFVFERFTVQPWQYDVPLPFDFNEYVENLVFFLLFSK